MKNNLHIEMYSGVSGDMLIASILDLGLVDEVYLMKELEKLHFGKVHLRREQVSLSGLSSTRIYFDVSQDADWDLGHHHHHDDKGHHHHRTYEDIVRIINNSSFNNNIKNRSKSIFKTLARAEGDVHGMPYEKVHFHEVGSMDAICDVVGFSILIDKLAIDKIYSSPFVLGRGEVQCAHGRMPVPVPAVMKILEATGCPSKRVIEETGELTTPTGCAILATCVDSFELPSVYSIEKTGLGAGHKEFSFRPNVLRINLFKEVRTIKKNDLIEKDEVFLVQSNIDDMTGELIGDLCDQLIMKGALDVWTTAIGMKKNRSAYELSMLVSKDMLNLMGDFLLENSTSIGYRYVMYERNKLLRKTIFKNFKDMEVRGKEIILPSGQKRIKFEYEDKKKISDKHGISMVDIDWELLKD